jgi:SAM-dependent methyltransferase
MIDMTSLDPARLDAAMGKTFGELGVGVTGPLIVLGDRLGLWAALAGAGPTTPGELAGKTGLNERYLSEWLRALAVAGYLEYDPAGTTFTLSAEMAAVLATDNAPTSLIGLFSGFEALWADLAHLETFFRTGQGMGWGDHHPSMAGSQERFTRPLYEAGLATAWLPAVEGADRALRASGRLLDVGCGRGVASFIIAKAYPQARVTGIDGDDAAIAHARKTAAEAGLGDRVSFEVADASAVPGGPYDVVLFSDSLHDMGDPVAAIAAAGRALMPSGVLLVVEPLAADRFEDDFTNPYARVGYAISTMACVPSALAQPGSTALGAMAGEARLRDVLTAGGMNHIRRIATDTAPFNILLEARP